MTRENEGLQSLGKNTEYRMDYAPVVARHLLFCAVVMKLL